MQSRINDRDYLSAKYVLVFHCRSNPDHFFDSFASCY